MEAQPVNHKIGTYLLAYSVFLFIAGITGYLMNPDHAITSLAGGTAGAVFIAALSRLYRKNILWAQSGVHAILAVFSLTFLWRGATQWWIVIAHGTTEKTGIALLLTALFVVSLLLGVLIVRLRRNT
ncbi:MAG: hypothetical protein JNL32_01805 [Candidatus Kapabacteria bacterium]|nr:hypothetical protein [Candidatus Kapabacteria bacterium]